MGRILGNIRARASCRSKVELGVHFCKTSKHPCLMGSRKLTKWKVKRGSTDLVVTCAWARRPLGRLISIDGSHVETPCVIFFDLYIGRDTAMPVYFLVYFLVYHRLPYFWSHHVLLRTMASPTPFSGHSNLPFPGSRQH